MIQLQTVQNTSGQLLSKPLTGCDNNDEVIRVEIVKEKGFSLLDFFVIVAALLVVVFLGYLFLNPSKEGSDTRNVHRSADLANILTSLTSYAGSAEDIETIPISENCVETGHEICKSGPYNCSGYVNLSFLVDSVDATSLLTTVPVDPSNSSYNGTGYYIVQDGQGSVTVCAPYSERNVEIVFTKYVY